MPCRRGHDRRLPSLLLLGLVAAAPAHAQDKTASIDRIFSWVKPGSPGCVAAASHNGALVVNRAYGLADLERNVPLTADSVFDAASIRKQFVAAAILLLVEEKRLALTDDVRKYIPELPDYGRTITLDHMLSHTSGLRDWTGLRNFNSGSEPAMPMILRQRALDFAPGEEWAYSNSGYVLLTEIVARRSGMPFSEFARTRLFEPLGMTSTTYVDDLRQVVKNRALAFEPQGAGWRMDMLIDNERGGGGALFSTASDLVLWSDGLTSGRLGRFVTDKLEEPAKLNNGRVLDYGRGLSRAPTMPAACSTTAAALLGSDRFWSVFRTAASPLPSSVTPAKRRTIAMVSRRAFSISSPLLAASARRLPRPQRPPAARPSKAWTFPARLGSSSTTRPAGCSALPPPTAGSSSQAPARWSR